MNEVKECHDKRRLK